VTCRQFELSLTPCFFFFKVGEGTLKKHRYPGYLVGDFFLNPTSYTMCKRLHLTIR